MLPTATSRLRDTSLAAAAASGRGDYERTGIQDRLWQQSMIEVHRRLRRWFRRLGRESLAFGIGLICIAAVSVHDAILVILHDDVIYEFEQNPLGRWLLRIQGGDVWLFVLVKLTGTAVVCAALAALYEKHRRMALVATGALAAFQVGLLLYLLLV